MGENRLPSEPFGVEIRDVVLHRNCLINWGILFRQQLLDGSIRPISLMARVEEDGHRDSRPLLVRHHPVLHACELVVAYELQFRSKSTDDEIKEENIAIKHEQGFSSYSRPEGDHQCSPQ